MKHYDKFQLAELINESYPSLQVNASTLQISPYQASVNDSLLLGESNVSNIKSLYLGSLEWLQSPQSQFEIKVITREPTRIGTFFIQRNYASIPTSIETFVSYKNLLLSYLEVTQNSVFPSGIVFHGYKLNW